MERQRFGQLRHQLDGIAALLLFAVFAVCILVVLLTGADAYRRLTDRDRQAHEERSCVQYLSQRIRQADCRGGIEIQENFDDVQALILTGEPTAEGDAVYVTRVYCYNGWLMELYSDKDTDLGPEAGEQIMRTQDLEFVFDDGTLYIKVTNSDGEIDRLLMSPRSGEGTK